MKNIFNNKNRKLIIGLIILLVGISLSLAFLIPQIMSGDTADAKITSDTTDNLTFDVSNDMSLKITQFNLAQGGSNVTDNATATARLLANNTNNTANYTYNVYLLIDKNEYIYTTEDEKPEIVMNVMNPNDTEVTSIEGLEYVTAGEVTGFDITTKSGLITIASEYAISSNSSTTPTVHEWDVTLYFINLDSDQEENTGNSLSAKLMIQKEKIPTTIADVCASGDNFADCIKEMHTIDGINFLYLHDADLANGANDGSYRYAGASESVNNYVCFASDAEVCSDDNLYRIIGVFGDNVKLIKSDYATSAQLGTNGEYYGAYDYGSSTYKGTNYANIASYYWDNANYANVWANSALNTINLNTNYIAYLNGINTKWANMIETTTWKVGGNTWANIGTSAMNVVYQNEIVNPAESTTYTDEIGLMYVSDYGYAASPTYWTYPGYSSSGATNDYRAATGSNWMYMGLYEWTISRRSDYSNRAFYVYSTGYVGNNYVRRGYAVRPSFSLKSTVGYSGTGSGSASDPFRIS